MRKILSGVFALLAVATANASITLGVYNGQDSEGAACSVEFLNRSFEHNVPNPLNERYDVHVTFNGKTDGMTIAHPLVHNADEGNVSFEHDLLQGHRGVKNGAKLLTLVVGDHKPSHFKYYVHSWKDEVRASFVCGHLTLATHR